MFFASDNGSGAAPEIMAALSAANDAYARGYGNDALTARACDAVREVLEAPQAAVCLVATGTAANALALATVCPPWGAVFCHTHAHIAEDECGAPEFYSGGGKLVLVDGDHGKMTLPALRDAIARTGTSVHGVQRGAVSITTVTEAGTTYTPAEIAALTAEASAFGLPSHLDGARFANALVATGATPAEMTWKAGIDLLSFGGTKNGCLGVEAVVFFDPAKAWEFELRRKRGGHLASKHRFLAAQMAAYLENGLWLRLAAQANAMATRLAEGLARTPGIRQQHPVQANMMFPDWPAGTHARLQAAGAVYYQMPAPAGREAARLVTSWSTTEAEIDRFLAAFG
ncbi:low specificity L-threonine aldolase [Rhodobacter sp. Har01]|uniref:threonine aldolase family protein n=1 Tax=Rhodobacter sp. Har01 TaxID=2883999 RepID=UPI001D06FC21|nr:low specificity L-threonine aldolase [Rhodobacter sp. Har01]MCB6179188.1 low specificity L-threonine aldolase [Rhodobacter sp. Har01]